MKVGGEPKDSISEVFHNLGLEAEEERERFRLLAQLGTTDGKERENLRDEVSDTRNNTATKENHA